MANATRYAIQLTTLGGRTVFLATAREFAATGDWGTEDTKRAWTWGTLAGAERALSEYPEMKIQCAAKIVTL
jgi:hypothetical protein